MIIETRLWSVGRSSRRRLVVVSSSQSASLARRVVVVVVVVSPVVSRHGVARRARAGRRPHRARETSSRVDIIARANATRRPRGGGPVVVVVVVVVVTVVTVASGRARAVGGDGTTREDTSGRNRWESARRRRPRFRWLADAIEVAADACAEEALEGRLVSETYDLTREIARATNAGVARRRRRRRRAAAHRATH